VGAVLGFLRFNTHPARVFMGDAGSQILGFSVAALSVALTQDQTAPLSSALPLLLLGIPVIDTLMVMTERMAAGRSPFKADRTHVHHRLLSLGFDHHEAVMVIYVLQAALFVAAWFLRYESDVLIVVVFAAAVAGVIGSLRVAERLQWRWRRMQTGKVDTESALRRQIKWLAQPQRLPRWSLWSIVSLMALYAVPIAAFGSPASSDIRWLAVALGGLLFGCIVLREIAPQVRIVEKAALYLSAVLIVYLDEWTQAGVAPLRDLHWLLFPWLAASVAIRIRLSAERRFNVTPLDLLVILLAVVLPNLPGSVATPHTLGVSVAKLVVMFYAMEALTTGIAHRGRWISSAVLGVLALFALRYA
jgi:UDP-GlcNAc:undecaprenyl-phosphate GlcNAc-1-phosphate transferase